MREDISRKDCFKAIINNSWDRVDQDIEDVMRSALARKVDILDLDFTASMVSSVVKQSILDIIDDLSDFPDMEEQSENN